MQCKGIKQRNTVEIVDDECGLTNFQSMNE